MSSVNARVPPLRLMAVDTPSDGQIPSYQSSSGEFEWVDDSSGGTPGGSNNEIQFNNSGAFDGDAGLIMSVKGDGNTTKIQVGNLKVGAAIVETAATNGFVTIACDGTGQIFLQSGNGAGGTWTDSVVNIMCNANTNNAQLKFRDNGNTDNGSITLDSSGDMVLNNNVANKDIDLKILGTGQVEIANQTTNNDTTLSIKGNGTGDAKINLNNPSKAVTLLCDTNQKLKVQGGVNSFVFDASSGTGGITFPDGTTQTTAASGGGFPKQPTAGDMNDATWNALHASRLYGNSNNTGTRSVGTSTYFAQFLAYKTGNVSAIASYVQTATAGVSFDVGIYDTDSDGLPDNLLGKVTLSAASTGVVSSTSISSTISLTAGETYWYGTVRTAGGNGAFLRATGNNGSEAYSVFGTSSSSLTSSVHQVLYDLNSTSALPSSVTTSDLYVSSNGRQFVGIKF